MKARQQKAARNPFATRWTRPGALPFIFPDGGSVGDLVNRLREQAWLGQIAGPHGSGKSTLIEQLEPAIRSAHRRTLRVTLCDRQVSACHDTPDRSRRGIWRFLRQLQSDSVLIVDGFEQLSWTWRHWLPIRCQRRGCGLLVTTHRPCRLPVLYETSLPNWLVHRVVGELLQSHAKLLEPSDVDQAIERHPDNLREILFELYDVYRRRIDSMVLV